MLVQFPKGLVPDPASDWGLFALMNAANNYSQNPLIINTTDQAFLLTAAQVVGNGMLLFTGAPAGPSVFTLPTAVEMIEKMRGPMNMPTDGTYSEPLRIVNQTGWDITLIGNDGLTLSGTMIIAEGTFRDFMITLDTATTITVLNVGTGGSDSITASIQGTANQIIVTEFNGVITLSTPQDIAPSSSPQFASLTLQGNLNFFGQGHRITGNFDNSSPANRLLFQSSNPGTNTFVGAIPNASNTSGFDVYSATDANNASFGRFQVIAATEVRISSEIIGSGTLLPITTYIDGAKRLHLTTTGLFGVNMTPSTTLDITSSASNAGIRVTDGTVSSILFNTTSNSASIGTTSNHPVNIFANNAARINVRQSGEVGIGINATAGNILQLRGSADRDLTFSTQVALPGAVSISAVNDAVSVNIPLELRANSFGFTGIGTTIHIDNAGNIFPATTNVANLGGASNRWATVFANAINVLTTFSAPHLGGSGGTPSVVLGPGAGAGATFTITGTDTAFKLSVLTAGSPSVSGVIATITYAVAYASVPYVVRSPYAFPASSQLSGSSNPYISNTATTITMTAGTVALSPGVQYEWIFQTIQ